MSGGFIVSLSALEVSAVSWKNFCSVVEPVFCWCIDADDGSASVLPESMPRGFGTETGDALSLVLVECSSGIAI
jgi:hypothetical protein